MAEDETTDTTEEETEEGTEETEGTEEGTEEEDSSQGSEELKKIIRQRDKAKAELRKAREELAAASKKDEKEDPIVKANRRIVAAEARAQLSAAGVTDKEDQAEVLEVINLANIDVDDDGEVDSDAIEEIVSNLRRIFGGEQRTTRRVPKTTTSRDKGGNENTPSDPDKARYRRILGGRK